MSSSTHVSHQHQSRITSSAKVIYIHLSTLLADADPRSLSTSSPPLHSFSPSSTTNSFFLPAVVEEESTEFLKRVETFLTNNSLQQACSRGTTWLDEAQLMSTDQDEGKDDRQISPSGASHVYDTDANVLYDASEEDEDVVSPPRKRQRKRRLISHRQRTLKWQCTLDAVTWPKLHIALNQIRTLIHLRRLEEQHPALLLPLLTHLSHRPRPYTEAEVQERARTLASHAKRILRTGPLSTLRQNRVRLHVARLIREATPAGYRNLPAHVTESFRREFAWDEKTFAKERRKGSKWQQIVGPPFHPANVDTGPEAGWGLLCVMPLDKNSDEPQLSTADQFVTMNNEDIDTFAMTWRTEFRELRGILARLGAEVWDVINGAKPCQNLSPGLGVIVDGDKTFENMGEAALRELLAPWTDVFATEQMSEGSRVSSESPVGCMDDQVARNSGYDEG